MNQQPEQGGIITVCTVTHRPFNRTSYLFSLVLKGGKKAESEQLLHVLTLIYSLIFASTLLMYMNRLLSSRVSSFVRL